MLRFLKSILIIVLVSNTLIAQQDPGYTQYYYNMNVVNPAYSTTDLGMLNLGANYRKQWVGAVGGPTTMSFFAHTPFNEELEMGITFTNDQIGQDVILLNEKNINADFSDVLYLNEKSRLALGLKVGFSLFDSNFTGTTIEPDDPVFDNSKLSRAFPTAGAGAYYFTDNYYLGISTPNVIRSTQINDTTVKSTLGQEAIHYYIIGGYVFSVNEDLKLKPSFMVRAVKGAPVNLDLSLNVLIKERFEAGLSYRYGDAISAIVGLRVTPALKFAYSYDLTVSEFSKYNSGTHEIVLLFDVPLFEINRGYKKSPRFF